MTGRGVVERVLITGKLVLKTPTHLGSGDTVGLTDMALLRDPVDRTPLLTGASIAGALRSYLREYEHGYGEKERRGDLAQSLFGALEKEASVQSWLLVDDCRGHAVGMELRDGVAIDPETRTAEEGKKFDIELLAAGTTFDLSFELLLPRNGEKLLEALALALRGLQEGEIGLGMRKRRGLGQCSAGEWKVRRYRLTTPQGLIGWLTDDRSSEKSGKDIFTLLDTGPPVPDKRESFDIKAAFELDSSLLIRSGSGGPDSPDMVHLHSQRGGKARPILSGTSLAGAVRARALRIANTLRLQDGKGLIDGMFGQRIKSAEDTPSASRVLTEESPLEGTSDWVQSRVKIDRFTGGSFPGALFTQQPAFGGDGSAVRVKLTLRQPEEHEIGLLLLVLKDLWTGDLPLGGESSVGRGRLSGADATLTLRRKEQIKEWRLEQTADGLEITGSGTRDELEAYVDKLRERRRTA
jgi:CRISPR/Cas system CSM-associated protein Csm3 (group 7 of RAMP superfamily)